MDFKPVYAQAMRDQAPKIFNRIVRSGQFQAHLQEKSREAHELFRYLTNNQPISEMGSSDLQNAERLVFETMLDFPDENPEPLDPLGRNQPKSPPAE